MKEDKYYIQFKILKDISLKSVDGLDFDNMVLSAISQTAQSIGLHACSLIMWDDNFAKTMSVPYAESDDYKIRLDKLETELFDGLRRNKDLVSAYVSFGGGEPLAAFTLPLRSKSSVYGAVIGIQAGAATLVIEDEFLAGITAALSVSLLNTRIDKIVDEARKELLKATAAAVNDRVNNELQTILSPIQMILRDNTITDENLIQKFNDIVKSTENISRTVKKLSQIDDIKFTEYIDGTDMLDLSEDD